MFWLCSAAVVLIMAAIFAFSQQPGEKSAELSKIVLEKVKTAGLDVFTPEITLGDDQKTDDGKGFTFKLTVRKWAHLYLYALLGAAELLWWLQLMKLRSGSLFKRQIRRRHPWSSALAFGFCLIYACTDEIHQLFVDSREGRPGDILYDAIGFSLGIILALGLTLLIRTLYRRIHK